MAIPHDAPTSAELLESVREWLDREVIPSSDGRMRFHARVAGNILAMVEREIALGEMHETAVLPTTPHWQPRSEMVSLLTGQKNSAPSSWILCWTNSPSPTPGTYRPADPTAVSVVSR